MFVFFVLFVFFVRLMLFMTVTSHDALGQGFARRPIVAVVVIVFAGIVVVIAIVIRFVVVVAGLINNRTLLVAVVIVMMMATGDEAKAGSDNDRPRDPRCDTRIHLAPFLPASGAMRLLNTAYNKGHR